MGYFLASFKNPTTLINDITANGSTLVIKDHSNYRNFSDFSISGAATSITLPATASTYDDYYNGYEITILAGTGIGERKIITDYVGSTRVCTVAAWGVPPNATSVFEIGQPGHLKEYFTDFRKIKIECPDATTYLFSTLGDGDATTLTPAVATLPISDTYTYTTGDGVYTITLYTLPTWSATVAYKLINNTHVYYGTKVYKILADSTNNIPSASPTYWEEITDIDLLQAKYRQVVKIAVFCDVEYCYNTKVISVNNSIACNLCNKEQFMRNPEVIQVMQIEMGLLAIPELVKNGEWDKVQNTLTNLKSICCCG